MVADKGKKPKTSENNEEEEQLDTELVLSIEKLQEIQDELEKINEKASEEVLEVEQKYNVVRKPVYDKRSDIIKSIPDFWLTADMKSGYSITFNFSPNSYFEDAKLTKTFTFTDDGTTKITATPIKWKEGMGGTNGVAHEKNGNKRPHEEDSFFGWFSETQQKDDMDEIQDQVAEIIVEDLWSNPLAYFNNDADEEDMEGDEEEDGEESEDEEQ
nr:NAP1-related protein 1-like [Tanacetum cinerariifolium]